MHKHKLEQILSNVPRTLAEKSMMSVSSELFEAVNSPRSLAMHMLLQNREYAQLVKMEINPDNYLNAQAFADDYLVTKFLSKFPDFSHEDLDPEQEALTSFFKYEEACRLTNLKFRELEEDPSKWDPSMQGILLLARRKIASVLGVPDLNEISSSFGWGPGATTAASGSYTSAYVKFKSKLDVTSNALVMGHCCINSTPSWVNCQLQTDEFPSVSISLTRDCLNVVRGNEIVFVPKNAKTHRIIAKEPHVNSYLQKGFGTYIRNRLRIAAGIDLKDQSLNQRLAKEGSLSNKLATIDLSGASDTISQELVRFLLPKRWYLLLDQIRSKQGFLRKKQTWLYYHKFSSMGNACTFELESLIFWALCKSCLEVNGGAQTLNVYGDDIVVPTEHYENVVKVIDFVGFTVNQSKSFSSGNFRESCGKDYFFGTDVRPIFLKETVSNVESLYKLANSIRRYAHRRNFNCGCDLRFHTAWSGLVVRLPTSLRGLYVPEGNGDSGLLANLDEACPSLARYSKEYFGWEGYVFKAITRVPVKQAMRDSHAGYTATLSASGNHQTTDESHKRIESTFKELIDSGFSVKESLRLLGHSAPGDEKLPLLGHHDLRKMTYPKIARIHTHGWYDLGPWN